MWQFTARWLFINSQQTKAIIEENLSTDECLTRLRKQCWQNTIDELLSSIHTLASYRMVVKSVYCDGAHIRLPLANLAIYHSYS